MEENFSCPSCGATLQYSGTGRTVKCPYCATVAEVPQALWQAVEQARSISQWKKWIGVFLVVTVGIPTCLSIVGAVVGIGGGIFAAILPFLLSLLGK